LEKTMKYAIVEDGGKQYRAVEGGTIEVDRYPSEVGDQIDLDRVLMIADGSDVTIGTPTIPGARVQATVISQVKGPKIVVFKYKPKIRYRVKKGHRQQYTRLKIERPQDCGVQIQAQDPLSREEGASPTVHTVENRRYSVGTGNGIGGRNGSQKRRWFKPQRPR
jgi:large subunit ribosomal protein L21